MRRERPHPGVQLSLFDTIEGMRHTAFITNQASADVAVLELQQRQRARAENVIRDAKATELSNWPFDDIVNNDVWMQLCFAENVCSAGPNASAAPANSVAPHPRRSDTGS